MRKVTNLLLVLSVVVCVGVMGCSDLMDSVTPCRIPQKTQEYLEIDKSITSLLDAKELALDVDIKHRDVLVACQRVVEDDEYEYELAQEIRNTIITSGEFQDAVIGSAEQPFSVMGVLAGAGLLGAGARFLPRKREKDLEKEVAELKNRSA
jgi:hypothetical protein